MKLIDEKTGAPRERGDPIRTFRDELGTLVDWIEPQMRGSTGRVIIKLDKGGEYAYYPSVIGAKFVEDEE